MSNLKCPKAIKLLLANIRKEVKSILNDNLVGIYLHGSLPMGSFKIHTSDVDFLIIVKKPLSIATKKRLIFTLIELSQYAPAKGLEMSVILLKYLKHFQYPTPFELHYSKDWKDNYLANKVDYTKKDDDKDLASHFVKTKKRGYRLYGSPINSIFPEIPNDLYWKSIMYDLDEVEKDIVNNPVYGVLNLCRTLKDIRENTVSSKAEGGKWALKNIPKYRSLVNKALNSYQRAQSVKWNKATLKAFAKFMLKEIKNNLTLAK